MDNNELLMSILEKVNALSERVAALEKQERIIDDTASTANTLVRRDSNGYIQVSRVGVGISPATAVDVRGTSPLIRVATASTGQNAELRFSEDATIKGRLIYAGGNSAGAQYFGFINSAGDYLGFFADSARFLTLAAAEIARFETGGLNLGNTRTVSVAGTQVITSRRTGWGAPTGTATRTTFATGTVTTAQLAERVKALIDDLISHGLIGT